MSKCDLCQNKPYCEDSLHASETCKANGYEAFSPCTNADRIRAMTDEELAENLFRHICNWSCPPQKEYTKASCGSEEPDCVKCWLDWLRQKEDKK